MTDSPKNWSRSAVEGIGMRFSTVVRPRPDYGGQVSFRFSVAGFPFSICNCGTNRKPKTEYCKPKTSREAAAVAFDCADSDRADFGGPGDLGFAGRENWPSDLAERVRRNRLWPHQLECRRRFCVSRNRSFSLVSRWQKRAV